MVTIIAENGSELKIEGTFNEVVKTFRSKPKTKVLKSRINKNMTIWIDGRNMGEIIKMECYIDFLDSKNNFKETRKEFANYQDALSFLKSDFEKYHLDMINYF